MVSFERLSRMYTGSVATSYERQRVDRKWSAERAAMQDLLTYVADGAKILDVPIGTGRFLPDYVAHDFDVCGLDISQEMMSQARAAADQLGARIQLEQGDIRSIRFPDGSFDLVV